jgi:tRNA (mo5U34)-methyltransferase
MDWWHTIELPDGKVTPGRIDYRGANGARFLVPPDLTGKSVLDFGTWDGFWAIEAKKRGAEVIATDRWDPPLETAALALGAYGIPYFYTGNLDEPFEDVCAGFDMVFFFGILYHLKNPYQGLKNAADCCKPGGLVLVETAVNEGKMSEMPGDPPLLWVIDEVHHGDPTNYFMPNTPAVAQLCRMAGLEPTGQRAVDGTRLTIACQKVGE